MQKNIQSESVQKDFAKRLQEVLALIQEAGFAYREIGVFGSYARGTYKNSSDIDICVVVDQKPPRCISGPLREKAELKRVDIVFVTPEYLSTTPDVFSKQLKQDYQKVL